MTGEARKRGIRSDILMGFLSAVIYSTVFLSPVFLLPVQGIGARKGYRALLNAASVSFLAIALIQLVIFFRSGAAGMGLFLSGLSAPFALLLAIIFTAAPSLKKMDFTFRVIIASILASLIVLPFLLMLGKSPEIYAIFTEAGERANELIGNESINAEYLWESLKAAMLSSFGSAIFILVYLSAWIGARYDRRRNPLPEIIPADELTAVNELKEEIHPDEEALEAMPELPPLLESYKVPGITVWFFMVSWAFILLNRFIPSTLLFAAGWNLAIMFSIVYAFQGLAIILALARRKGMATAARALAPLLIIIVILGGKIGLIVMGAVALLGTLETWTDLRKNSKGESE